MRGDRGRGGRRALAARARARALGCDPALRRAEPEVAVLAEDQRRAARQRVAVRLRAPHQRVRHAHEHTARQPPVARRPRVQRQRAVVVHTLHLRLHTEQVTSSYNEGSNTGTYSY